MTELFNPVIISVIVMITLCLMSLNVMLAILIAALVAGLTGGFTLTDTMQLLIKGMGGNAETALSYVLLGALAVAINKTGAAAVMAQRIALMVGKSKMILLLVITLLACFSQNLVPVHIAFIPILIPPLLPLMDRLKLDRRAVASSLTFGLTAPYIVLPVGFGLIFQNLIKDQMIANGISVDISMIWQSMWLPGLGMLVGLLFAVLISYKKKRVYREEVAVVNTEKISLKPAHYWTLLAAILAFAIQLLTGSLPLGALAGLLVMFFSRAINRKELEEVMHDGVGVMGFIAVVMLVAAGYAGVIRETHAVEGLVSSITQLVGASKLGGAMLMILIGLFVTMGIGTSFGTVPIIATIYCPLGLELGFSTAGIIALIGVAGALGDAGSPASDSTLGPTSGLAADGQHDHIWDTCVPTFLHYNIPLVIFGVIASLVL
ncbi:Na+/H+ antiporter NhaC family protein [Limibacter armeniacum]|uniref:Na+/H+ antiporter family protein n=1 Tax=Limibacter armeniacum TaxID=466084 RepID=UPI002FE62C7F